MSVIMILSSKQIDPSQVIFQIKAEEALNSFEEMIDEFSLNIDFSNLSKEEIEKLLSDYADAVVTYHPHDYHQERAVFLKNETMLKKCGLTDDDIRMLDFT
jgi:hypothetical protein